LRDVDGAGVDKLLETKAGRGLGGAVGRDGVWVLNTDGHDTVLLKMHAAQLAFVSLLDDGK
jgi:hypothetical protein